MCWLPPLLTGTQTIACQDSCGASVSFHNPNAISSIPEPPRPSGLAVPGVIAPQIRGHTSQFTLFSPNPHKAPAGQLRACAFPKLKWNCLSYLSHKSSPTGHQTEVQVYPSSSKPSKIRIIKNYKFKHQFNTGDPEIHMKVQRTWIEEYRSLPQTGQQSSFMLASFHVMMLDGTVGAAGEENTSVVVLTIGPCMLQ